MASPSLPNTAAGSVTGGRELVEMRERVRARGRSVAGVVDALGGEIRHAADWRTHAARHPLWALGAAAGVGLLAAALVRRRPAPEARLLEAATSSLEALADRDCVLETLHEAGWETRVEVPHWLAKARRGETFVDVIHSSGNGVARVDDLWFTHSVPGQVLGVETRLVPVEEMIWSKAFVMENYRFDGADVAHLLLIQGHRIDWDRLLLRFGRNWRVLLGHLLFFGFIYPEQQNLVPQAFLVYWETPRLCRGIGYTRFSPCSGARETRPPRRSPTRRPERPPVEARCSRASWSVHSRRCAPRREWRCCTTPRSQPPWWGSRSKSIPSWDRAASRSLSTATASI